ncbi:MAG: Gfo/Idh/MocA family oxidoreductase [Pseudomonadota bacterium]
MSEQVKVAVAGAGYFAQFQYEAWTRIPEVALVGCANRTIAKAEECAAKYSIPAAFADVDDMLANTKPDILDIITPPETHLDAIKIAARHGVDVICQKPYCPTISEAEEATHIARSAGISVVIHENFRFQPWYREARKILASGALGTPYQITFRLRPGDGQGPDAYLARQPYFQAMPRFLVHETAIHLIDTFRFLFGEIESVTAALRKLNPVIAGEDAGIILFEFKSGARGLFDGNRLVDHKAKNHRLTMGELLIEGSGGSLRMDGDANLFLRKMGEYDEHPVAYTWHDHAFGGDCVYELQRSVIANRLNRKDYENLAEDYLRNISIEEAVYESQATGRRISL